MKYKLIVTETGRKAGKYFYKVIDEDFNVLASRHSNREYVACTINGQYYFGRLDLIGKGDHAKQLKWCAEHGKEPVPIAYKGTEMDYTRAHAYLSALEAKEGFERGSLTDGFQNQKSYIRQRIFKHMIKTKCETGQVPAWWKEAVIAATVVDEHYNNFKGWE